MEHPLSGEGHEIPIAISSSPPSDHDHVEDHPVGSPELADSQLPQPSDQPHVLSDDLRHKIIKQVEYYFSDENLPDDKFLMKYVSENKGFVPIGVIASFRKMKRLSKDTSMIVTALRESSFLVVSASGKNVKRLHPLSLADTRDPMVCTVLVENLPEDHSVENLRLLFGEAGSIRNITLRDPHNARDPKKCTIAEKLIRGRLHALVEYDTVEAAEKAVAILNNEQDWRHGLRVKLLKKMDKTGQKKQVWKDSQPEKSSTVQKSQPVKTTTVQKSQPEKISIVPTSVPGIAENHGLSKQHDDSHTHDDEDVDHSSREKNGVHLPNKEKNGHKGRNGGRGRRQMYHSTNGGHGHGTQLTGHCFEPSKPPPGPKMPDGTRGFTMGRGRPLVSTD